MPCTFAMTGCGSRVIVSIIRLQRATSDSTSVTPAMPRISLRSWPAQKPRPLAASTTTRTRGSSAMRSNADCSSLMRALDSALNCAGRLSVTVAMPSAMSTSSWVSAWFAGADIGPLRRISAGRLPSEREASRDQPVLVGFALQRFAEVRMRDADQGLGALGHRLALQVRQAVLGDDEHDIRARRGHDVARRQPEDDSASPLAALVIRRREADERPAALRGIGPAHELQLPAGAAQMT